LDKTVKVNQHLLKPLLTNLNNEGDIKLGHNVQVGYFAQNQAEYLMGDYIASNNGRRGNRH
jgi:ATPase subunit of ABC transporter with duplicated ATPase domains